jgi:Tol biopolymer transport system component
MPGSPHAPHPVPVRKERLESWKEIAAYLNRDVSTVRRWEQRKGLPVHRVAGGERDTIFALRSEIDQWWAGGAAHKSPVPGKPRGRWAKVALAGAGIMLAAGWFAWRYVARPAGVTLKAAPLTSYPGDEVLPAFSPDGRFVAFTWNGEKQDNYDVYVKPVAGDGAPVRVTADPALDMFPSWSPDGTRLLFVRWTMGTPKADLLLVPAFGGPERKVGETLLPVQHPTFVPPAAWTGAGGLITARAVAAEGPLALVHTNIETRESSPVVEPVANSAGDCCPALSPDGRALAFVRTSSGGTSNLFQVDIDAGGRAEGTPRQLTFEAESAVNPMWTSDGRELLYVAGRQGTAGLWRIPAAGGTPRLVRELGEFGRYTTVTNRGDRLIYATFTGDEDVWAADARKAGSPRRLISSSLVDRAPDASPDGKRIAFISTRSGSPRIWVADIEGRNAVEVAATTGFLAGAPRWSPDGTEIAYECRFGDNGDICAVPSVGGEPRRLTRHPSRDMLPGWSRDGRFVYLTSDREDGFQIWKVPAQGEGARTPALRVTRAGGYGAVESADGHSLFYTKGWLGGRVARMPAEGGPETAMDEEVRSPRMPQNFAVGADGIRYAASSDPRTWFEIRFQPFGGGQPVTLFRIEQCLGNGMSLTPDGETLLFSSVAVRGGDLVMLEDFR